MLNDLELAELSNITNIPFIDESYCEVIYNELTTVSFVPEYYVMWAFVVGFLLGVIFMKIRGEFNVSEKS